MGSRPQASDLIVPWVRELLRCPVTGAELVDAVGPDGQIELVSTSEVNPLAYPVRDGVPILLEAEARRLAAPVAGSPG
ncbi:hypothetical protein MF406_05965 [Georgenia sp. TF02-10]|uniref:Trm112 family protein n=1 Tax=Georgenia sp. TF02-10 TaxID=2917725 RepID=UPI001FA79C6A|nr:hypothetical protein [Georgenia sp. TF02-10]UNX55778.1 hypothetical protein MF406_05965 [Georgenia sp. TF02-10]